MSDAEKRHFHRVGFDGAAWLSCGIKEQACTIVDLSLHGALVTTGSPLDPGCECTLRIPLAEDAEIAMRIRVVRTSGVEHRMALECLTIDIDSIQHLRRLVELNLGDETLLQRDLAALHPA